MKKNSKIFIDHSETTDDVYENLEDSNQTKKKVLMVFDDIIADIEANKKLSHIVTELFIKGRKLNISYVPKDVRLNVTHYFLMKIPNIR